MSKKIFKILQLKFQRNICEYVGTIQKKYPDVDIGSYPYFKKKSFGVSLIIKSDSEKLVKEVCGLIYDYLEQQNGKPRLF